MNEKETSLKLPEPWQKGDPLLARKLDEPGQVLRQIMRGVQPPRQVNPQSRAAAGSVRRFVLLLIEPDFLICRSWNGTVLGEADVFIAKSPLLRASATKRELAAGTVTYTAVNETGTQRTATIGGEDETQVVSPEWVVGDEIFAQRDVIGGTGVVRVVNNANVPVLWLDTNRDGRAWAEPEP